jgi:hypothetical protein
VLGKGAKLGGDGGGNDSVDNDDDGDTAPEDDVNSQRHAATQSFMQRVRKAAVKVRNNARARAMIGELQRHNNVSADRVAALQLANDTRWHSHYIALVSHLELRSYLLRVAGERDLCLLVEIGLKARARAQR